MRPAPTASSVSDATARPPLRTTKRWPARPTPRSEGCSNGGGQGCLSRSDGSLEPRPLPEPDATEQPALIADQSDLHCQVGKLALQLVGVDLLGVPAADQDCVGVDQCVEVDQRLLHAPIPA